MSRIILCSELPQFTLYEINSKVTIIKQTTRISYNYSKAIRKNLALILKNILRSSNYPELENALNIWFRQQRALNYPISATHSGSIAEIEKYFGQQLLNMDEAGLIWKSLPNKTLTHKNDISISSKI